ncbi:MAG: hypothetical protein ACLQPV_04480 [Vulcanimicrobiaceae bacterium]
MPVATFVLFAVVWAMQLGTIDERTQIAVRYSGLISQVASPYDDYSQYATYNNLEHGFNYEKSPPIGCVAPTTDALSNNNTNNAFPGPISGTFWWNAGDNGIGSCNATNVHAIINATAQKEIVLYNGPQMNATMPVPSFLQAALGGTSGVSATTNFYKPPNANVILNCYSSGTPVDMQDMAQASFQPWINQGPTPTAIPTPYPASVSAPVLAPNC